MRLSKSKQLLYNQTVLMTLVLWLIIMNDGFSFDFSITCTCTCSKYCFGSGLRG